MPKKRSSQRDVENAIKFCLSFGPLRFMQLFQLLNGKAVLQILPDLNWLPDGTTKPTLIKAIRSLIARGEVRRQRGAWLEAPEYDMPLELMFDAETGELAGLGSKTMRDLGNISAEDKRKRNDRALQRGNNPQRLRPDIQRQRVIKKIAGRWSSRAWSYELVYGKQAPLI